MLPSLASRTVTLSLADDEVSGYLVLGPFAAICSAALAQRPPRLAVTLLRLTTYLRSWVSIV